MEEKYCQSCAMPMGATDEMYGTEADGSKSSDYCKYCYENGKFTSNRTMDEMIEICVPHMVTANSGMSEDDARKSMKEFLPTLKRWKYNKVGNTMDHSIIEREAFKVVGIRRTTPHAAGTWAIVKKDINVSTAKKLFGKFYDLGLCFGFGADGSNDYMCAVEYSGDVPEGFESFAYPAETWAKFEVKGSIKEFGNTWQYINNEFLPQNKYEKSNPPIEKFTLFDVDVDKCDAEIWISFKKI